MSSVKSLPEAVRSSVRSGIILFDIARVVEELVFNSLDARASKVSVFVGIGTCYVKVSDDGTGITRDGLELVGERYATSKFDHLADTDTRAGTFGFRGEALASISDVSLLEIVTKAFGRPNGYRKVTKGSKCLYLGICDGLRDVGTTVSVRDLFYNQPVRRKYIQSSAKKVLQSIKKCVLRIALVYSKISFKVVDIESDEILLCTQASSPTLLLTSCFGIDVSTSLHKLDIDNGTLKLFGYISGPCDNLPIKAFQYVYINSRFVCKGPIHKLVNQLAATFECNEQGKAVKGTQNRKRSRPQTCPAFILNISCPRSFYDLTFEPTKTYVEFKDWVPVLAFLNEAIQLLWNENISYDVLGDTVEFATDIMEKEEMLCGYENAISAEDVGVENFPASSIIGEMKCSMINRQASPDPICSDLKILTEKDSYWSIRKHVVTPIKLSHEYSSYFKNERGKEMGFVSQTNQLGDCPFSESMPEVSRNCEYKMRISDDKFLPVKDYFSVNEANCGEWCRENDDDNNFSLGWEEDFVEGSPSNRSGSSSFALTRDCQQSSDVEMFEGVKEPFLKCCSLQGILPQASSMLTDSASDFQSDDDFKIKEILTSSYDGFNSSETKIRNQSFDCLTRTLWQDHESSFELLPSVDRKYWSAAELESLSGAFGESIPFCKEQFHGNDGFSFGSVPMRSYRGNGHLESESEWWSLTSDSYSQSTLWDEEHYSDINILEGRRNSKKPLTDNEENDRRYGYATLGKRSGRQNCAASCSNTGLEDSGSGRSHRGDGLNQNFSPNRSDIFSDETDWLCFDSHHKHCKSRGMYQSQRCRNNRGRGNIFHFTKERIRSHSAPPFFRSKRKFFSLDCCMTAERDKEPVCPEVHEHLKSIALANSSLDKRQILKNMRELKEAESNAKKEVHSVCLIQEAPPLKETITREVQESPNCGTKWRNYCSTTSSNNKSVQDQDQDNILDISSGFLHLASGSLVPESISKTCLEDATVLQQVDNKYIPIVAGRTLAVVDQHAADERIRLEELRQKVLTGEAKTVNFLEAEQELTLPEIGHQLLHNYSEEIKEWGWICNIHSRDSRSFKRSLNILHRQPTAITLKAVPCILGVNLSDVDLMEFLQQLADTDGSSMIPPSVLRILNSKACRGAIMFGDSLLPSECSLLISELKRTSLCFQCAHGRPTTAPLVNLEALHKQIAKMSSLNNGSHGSWHGLRRHELSLERAQQRLCI